MECSSTLRVMARRDIGYILILSRKIKIRENLPQTFTRPSHCVLILDQCQLDACIPFFLQKARSIANQNY